jgi:transposase InsO family protein
MPNLLVVIAKVKSAVFFATFDLFKGFWQLMLHPDCQEFFSFITNDTVYTPTRVSQGATDSPIHFQNQMQEVFRDMLYDNLLIWVDDIVVFARTAEEFIAVLRKFFARLHEYGLKLNAKKSCLYAKEISWCGRIIDGEGVRHDPERVAALSSLPRPGTAADLQKLLCAANWLRESIVNFAQFAAPLQAKLETVFAGHSRKQRYAESLLLTWTREEERQYGDFVDCIARSTKLVFPSETATICVTTDASDRGWSLIVSQVDQWDESQSITEQAHALVLSKGGMFKGAQLHWSIAEKEGYPIVRAAKDLEYLLHRSNGFKLFCDHANLIQIFCPGTEIRKHVRGKLQRWALMLSDYRYEIEHVKGSDNVWADLVSRWLVPRTDSPAAAKAIRTRASSTLSRLRPLMDPAFVWPRPDDVRAAQRRYRSSAPPHTVEADSGLLLVEGKMWIPTQAKELLARICVVAHGGLSGHRGADVMNRQLQRHYHVKTMATLVKKFVAECLLCKHVKGSQIIQRPWSEQQREPAARTEVLHFDFLFMGDSYGETCYVLVLKDELTHYCELVACDAPTSIVTVTAVLDWAKRFGLPSMWTSDKGTHFKNKLMEQLRDRLKTVHTFVPVYSPWVNGTVERINRDVLQVMRVLLLEHQLDTRSWEYVLPLVQANLNQTPVASLGGNAPVELFTGLTVPTQLDTVLLPDHKDKVMTINMDAVEEELDALRASLQQMHDEVVDHKERTQLYQKMAKEGTLENFNVGDFVLWSRVDERLRGNKLMVRWVGPFRVTEALEYSFIIEHLITGDKTEVHGSRLKFFDDASVEVDEEVLEHVAKQGIVLGVEAIRDHRFNSTTKQWELRISWRGLQEIEDSWEPLTSILNDAPVLVMAYAEEQQDEDFQAQVNGA